MQEHACTLNAWGLGYRALGPGCDPSGDGLAQLCSPFNLLQKIAFKLLQPLPTAKRVANQKLATHRRSTPLTCP